MAFNQAFMPVQLFANRYGKTSRSYQAINFFRDVSNANTSVSIDSNTFLARDGQGGKLRQVKLVYFPVSCDESGSCEDNVCGDAVAVQPKVIWFDVTQCTASEVFSIDAENIRMVDSETWDFNEVGMNIMLSRMPAFRRKLAKAMITRAYGMAGQHADGNETHQIVNLTNPEGRINPMGLVNLRQEHADLGLMEPYVLGGGDFYALEEMRRIGGLNNDGIYVNRAGFDNVYYDDGLQGELFNQLQFGNWALSVTPDTFKMVTYSRNAGIFRTDLASIDDLATLRRQSTIGSIHGTMIDPATGLMYDFDAKYDDCLDQWKFQWRLEWDFFVMPDVVCNDTIGDVNGMMKWRTCPQVIAECPTGQSPSTPVTPDTFAWTPTLSEIETVSQSTIHGYNAYQNQPVPTATLAALAAYMTDNSNITFSVNGSTIEYTGTEAIQATFNGGAVTATFA